MKYLPDSFSDYLENSKEIPNGRIIFPKSAIDHSPDWMHLICEKREQEFHFLENLLRDTDHKSLLCFWENAFFGGTLFQSNVQLYGPDLPQRRELELEGWAPLSIRAENEKRSQWVGEDRFCFGSLLGDQENYILECYNQDVRILHGSDIFEIKCRNVCSFIISLICKFEVMFEVTGGEYTDENIEKLIQKLQI